MLTKEHCRASKRGGTGVLGDGSNVNGGGIVWDVWHIAFRCRRGGYVDADSMEQAGEDPECLVEFGSQCQPGVGKGGFEWMRLGWSFIKLMPSDPAHVIFQGNAVGDREVGYVVGQSH